MNRPSSQHSTDEGTLLYVERPGKVVAVVTAYKPDQLFSARLAQTSSQVDHVFVVDNTPGGMVFSARDLPVNVTVIADGVNKGLAKALNIGIAEAMKRGAQFVLLFDQDSTPSRNFLADLLAGYLLLQKRVKVAVVSPLMIDERTGIPNVPKVERRNMIHDGIYERVSLATSGMLIPVKAFQEIGDFDTKLFLDFVDFEWCWRARSKGYLNFRVDKARLSHNLGSATRSLFMFKYSVPAPFRHYFQFRDTLNLALCPYAPVSQRLRLVLLMVAKLFVYPIILDAGPARFKWMYLGIRDFFLRKSGVGSAKFLLERDVV